MKKKLFSLILCFALFGQAQAQRYLPGQKGVQFMASAVDGFNLSKGEKQAFALGIGMATYNKSGNRWLLGAEYLQKQYGYKDELIPVSQFTGEFGYLINVLSDHSKTVFFSLGGSAMAGYETVNRSKKDLPDGAMLVNDGQLLYGGAVAFEIETFLSDRLVLLVNARERILYGSTVGKFHFQLGVGFKYIIN